MRVSLTAAKNLTPEKRSRNGRAIFSRDARDDFSPRTATASRTSRVKRRGERTNESLFFIDDTPRLVFAPKKMNPQPRIVPTARAPRASAARERRALSSLPPTTPVAGPAAYSRFSSLFFASFRTVFRTCRTALWFRRPRRRRRGARARSPGPALCAAPGR